MRFLVLTDFSALKYFVRSFKRTHLAQYIRSLRQVTTWDMIQSTQSFKIQHLLLTDKSHRHHSQEPEHVLDAQIRQIYVYRIILNLLTGPKDVGKKEK